MPTQLSTLVSAHKALTESVSINAARHELLRLSESISSCLSWCPELALYSLSDVTDKVNMITLNEIEDDLELVLCNVRAKIEQISARYLTKPWYIPLFTARIAQEEWLVMSRALSETLIGKIQKYSDWHYPALEIGPRNGEFTKYLVGNDPLYLVDVGPEYIDIVSQQYSPGYNARLRKSVIDFDSRLAGLPENQFGFIFSWNFFNYCPMDLLTLFLQESFDLLRPGGVMVFGYNNAETVNAAKQCEFGGMEYTPKTKVMETCGKIGFTITDSFDYEHSWYSFNWIEVRKPGELNTCKAHQVLGMVNNITE